MGEILERGLLGHGDTPSKVRGLTGPPLGPRGRAGAPPRAGWPSRAAGPPRARRDRRRVRIHTRGARAPLAARPSQCGRNGRRPPTPARQGLGDGDRATGTPSAPRHPEHAVAERHHAVAARGGALGEVEHRKPALERCARRPQHTGRRSARRRAGRRSRRARGPASRSPAMRRRRPWRLGRSGTRLAITSGSSQLTWLEARSTGPSGNGPSQLTSTPCRSSARREALAQHAGALAGGAVAGAHLAQPQRGEHHRLAEQRGARPRRRTRSRAVGGTSQRVRARSSGGASAATPGACFSAGAAAAPSTRPRRACAGGAARSPPLDARHDPASPGP